MNYKVQLLSFLLSFLYGVFFNITYDLNVLIIQNERKMFQYINMILYIINIVLIYIIILYKINIGVFHPYFIMMVIIGFAFMIKIKPIVTNYVKKAKKHIKRK